MFANVDYVLDFTNFSEYDKYVAEEANFASIHDGATKVSDFQLNKLKERLAPVKEKLEAKKLEAGVNEAKARQMEAKNAERAEQASKFLDKYQTTGDEKYLNEYKRLTKKNEKSSAAAESIRSGKKVTPSNVATKARLSVIPKTTAGKIAAGSTAGALVAGATTLGVMGARGVGPFATDNAKIARANRLAAKGHLDKANKVLGSVKDKTKLLGAPQAYAASEAE